MKWRKKMNAFSFTRNEREGAISLLVLIVLFIISQRYIATLSKPIWTPNEADVIAYIQQNEAVEEEFANAKSESTKASKSSEEAHFPFDPNTISDAQWIELGLSTKQVASLRKYMSFGYPFRFKKDLRKVYVLDSLWLNRHWDEIEIAPAKKADAAPIPSPQKRKEAPPKTNQVLEINLNTADTIALASVRGIGSYSARRIWNFREALGGFISLAQLNEVYGIREDAVQALSEVAILDSTGINQIDINIAEKEAFGHHPYCSWKLATAIVKYRAQHGPFEEIDDLKHIYLMTDSIFVNLKPYLTISHEHRSED